MIVGKKARGTPYRPCVLTLVSMILTERKREADQGMKRGHEGRRQMRFAPTDTQKERRLKLARPKNTRERGRAAGKGSRLSRPNSLVL